MDLREFFSPRNLPPLPLAGMSAPGRYGTRDSFGTGRVCGHLAPVGHRSRNLSTIAKYVSIPQEMRPTRNPSKNSPLPWIFLLTVVMANPVASA